MIARLLSTVIASILPLCSVVILYLVKANGLRLGIIVVLSACFSLALALMTNARKIEIFAATSAWVPVSLSLRPWWTKFADFGCFPSFAALNVVYLTNGGSCPAITWYVAFNGCGSYFLPFSWNLCSINVPRGLTVTSRRMRLTKISVVITPHTMPLLHIFITVALVNTSPSFTAKKQ